MPVTAAILWASSKANGYQISLLRDESGDLYLIADTPEHRHRLMMNAPGSATTEVWEEIASIVGIDALG